MIPMRGEITGVIRKRFPAFARIGFLALLICGIAPGARAVTPQTAAGADSSNPTLTLEQYEAELDRLASAVSDLPEHAGQIEALRKSLPPGWQVERGGEKYDVSAAWLASDLKDIEDRPKDRLALCDDAAKQLRSMRAEAEKIGTAAENPDRANARARITKILSQREYQQVHQSTWFARVWDQVQRWIEWLLDHTLGRLLGEGALRTTLLYVILIGVFLCVAVWLVRSLTSIVRSENFRADAVFPAGKHWRDWAREALAAATSGDYRAALHAAYWAGVYRLADLGAWHLDRARTPREYLRMLEEQRARGAEGGSHVRESDAEGIAAEQNPAGRAAALAALTRRMEASWYGYLPATEQDFDNAVNDLETLGCRLRSTAQTAKS
jgi:hypothetical protein